MEQKSDRKIPAMVNVKEALLKGESNTREHIQDVNTLLIRVAKIFLDRAVVHDASKLFEPEHEKFSLAAAKFGLPGNEFGSPGYEKTKADLGPALEHHYANNSHHPEFYKKHVCNLCFTEYNGENVTRFDDLPKIERCVGCHGGQFTEESDVLSMNLFDILEMLMDWKAASSRRAADGMLNFEILKKQHRLPDELIQILKNTCDHLSFDYHSEVEIPDQRKHFTDNVDPDLEDDFPEED